MNIMAVTLHTVGVAEQTLRAVCKGLTERMAQWYEGRVFAVNTAIGRVAPKSSERLEVLAAFNEIRFLNDNYRARHAL